MRRSPPAIALPAPEAAERRDWDTIKTLFPYLWTWKWRVILALSFLISAKFANVAVPMVFKEIIDSFTLPQEQALLLVPLGLLGAYGLLRFSTTLFGELRDVACRRKLFAIDLRGTRREFALRKSRDRIGDFGVAVFDT